MTELPELQVADAAAWRAWLDAHEDDPAGVRLVLCRKAGSPDTTLTYDQALDEALCSGWIDGQVGRRDQGSFFQRFTPRRARSAWSARNVGHVGRLVEDGRMRARGAAEVERAKADGRWDAAYAGQATIEVPPDLTAALAADPVARSTFDALTRQNRYAILLRLHSAQRPQTRGRRLEQYVGMLRRGETLHPQARRAGPPAG